MFDLVSLVQAAGYIGLFAIIFAESGLLIGFFLPGDSLIFTAGFLASQGFLNIWILAPLLFAAAASGDSVGYWFGKKVGPRVFKRDNSILFDKQHLDRARDFYERHGGKAVVLARFIPVIRTFAPILAGVGHMKYGTFVFYNIFGAAIWGAGVSWAGYYFGNAIPNADQYIIPIVLLIILTSVLPGMPQFIRTIKKRKHG